MLHIEYDELDKKCLATDEYGGKYVLPKRFEKYVDEKKGVFAEVGENSESLIFYI